MAVDYANASPTLDEMGIDINADFYSLCTYQVMALCDLARVQGYRKPKNANGSKARYYFAALQRDYKRNK